MPFFETLNYSSCNEDGLAELRALELGPADHVCCITGSGDRALHLLLGNPARVSAFDLNPAQNYLLELKMAAIRALDYPRYAGFLGLHSCPEARWPTYRQHLRPLLSPAAAAWFDGQRALLEPGILYAGRWERHFRRAARHLRLLRGKKIDTLLSFRELEAQRRFLHAEWNTWEWRLLLRLTFNRPVFRFVLRDPGFYAHIGGDLPPWRYIHDRMTSFLEHHLARSSFMMALIFNGTFFDPVHYPPYLQERNFPILKARLGRITLRTAPLFEVLDHPDFRSCNRYSLSDVSSFLPPADYRRLLAFFARKPGVRFCLRDFLTQRRAPPPEEAGAIRFLTGLQEQLARDDTSFGYTFLIGTTE